MGSSTVTRNFQVTIPKDVRRLEEIKVGDKLDFEHRKEGILVRKKSEDWIGKAFGAWGKGERGAVTIRRLRDKWEKKRVKKRRI